MCLGIAGAVPTRPRPRCPSKGFLRARQRAASLWTSYRFASKLQFSLFKSLSRVEPCNGDARKRLEWCDDCSTSTRSAGPILPTGRSFLDNRRRIQSAGNHFDCDIQRRQQTIYIWNFGSNSPNSIHGRLCLGHTKSTRSPYTLDGITAVWTIWLEEYHSGLFGGRLDATILPIVSIISIARSTTKATEPFTRRKTVSLIKEKHHYRLTFGRNAASNRSSPSNFSWLGGRFCRSVAWALQGRYWTNCIDHCRRSTAINTGSLGSIATTYAC